MTPYPHKRIHATCKPLMWVGDPLSCQGAARRYAHMASHSMLSPLGPIGRLSTPSAARSPSAPPCVPTFGDGQPDGSSRDRAAPCRTDARSAVTASAAVLGRRRATRCAAHLQNLTASTQDSCSAARARPAVAANRLSHSRIASAVSSAQEPATGRKSSRTVEALNLQLAAIHVLGSLPCRVAERLRVGASGLNGSTLRRTLRAGVECPDGCVVALASSRGPSASIKPAN